MRKTLISKLLRDLGVTEKLFLFTVIKRGKGTAKEYVLETTKCCKQRNDAKTHKTNATEKHHKTKMLKHRK